jgi:hypothetical protein
LHKIFFHPVMLLVLMLKFKNVIRFYLTKKRRKESNGCPRSVI